MLNRFLTIFLAFDNIHGAVLRLERVCHELAVDDEIVIVFAFHDILSLYHKISIFLHHGLKRPIIQITAKQDLFWPLCDLNFVREGATFLNNNL